MSKELRASLLKCLGAGVILSHAICVWGAEGASTEYVGGFAGFAAGYVPPEPGTYLTNYLYYYNGDTAAVAVNGKVALDVSTNVFFEIAQVTSLTKLTFLGGTYGFGAAVPLGYVNVDVGLNPVGIDRSASTVGFGDLILVPAVIGWHSRNWHTNVALSVFAPTGQYDKNRAINLSKHFWAIDGAYSASLLTETGFDLSGCLGYTVNFENPSTHYKSGDVVHLDLAVGQNLSKQIKVGLGGYAVVQVTANSGSGATLGSFESNIYAVGPLLFAGKTGFGDFADAVAEMDVHVGEILDAIVDLHVRENTIVVFTSDNGPEATWPWQGSSGPWRGYYFTHYGRLVARAIHHSLAGPNSRRPGKQ
jgi:hypothetical protein